MKPMPTLDQLLTHIPGPDLPGGGQITSDGGVMLLGQVDRLRRVAERLAACFDDRREPCRIEHSVEDLLRQRLYALALGYEDLNDHDELRKDPTLRCWRGS